MTKNFITQKLGVYTKELGMGIESISVGDIANSAFLSSFSPFFQSRLSECLILGMHLEVRQILIQVISKWLSRWGCWDLNQRLVATSPAIHFFH